MASTLWSTARLYVPRAVAAATVTASAWSMVVFADESSDAAPVTTSKPSWTKPTRSDIIKGNYENRLRQYANPEKVFEYFASVSVPDDDEVYMLPHDFMRAITPYNPDVGGEVGSPNPKFDQSRATSRAATPDEAKEYTDMLRAVVSDSKVTATELAELAAARKRLNIDNSTNVLCLRDIRMTPRQFDRMVEEKGYRKSSPFYDLADSDGDGLISFGEYMFFITLLSLPPSTFELALRVYDNNGDGLVDKSEFVQIMKMLRARTSQGKQVRDKSLVGGEKGRVQFAGQLVQFFGEGGDQKLSPKAFRSYVRQLHEAVHEHEFRQWDVSNDGMLQPYEFAMSLVTFAPSGAKSTLLARAEGLKTMKGAISKAEFMEFQRFLDCLDELEVALQLVASSDDGVTQEEFSAAAAAALRVSSLVEGGDSKKGKVCTATLSPVVVSVLYTMFDTNGDGRLSPESCLNALRSRQTCNLATSRDLGVIAQLRKLVNCAKETWF